MDKNFVNLYNRELQHLREHAGEFARAYPKIAARLALDNFDCADPYVERLLEGFAFLAARVQWKMDAEFPRFTEALLDTAYPQYLAPFPSMAIVRFEPDFGDGSLADGFTIERGQTLNSIRGGEIQTPCTFRTSSDVKLWPVEITQARYLIRELGSLDLSPLPREAKAAFHFRLKTTAGLKFNDTTLDELTFHLQGSGDHAARMFEQVVGHAARVMARPVGQDQPVFSKDKSHVEIMGLNKDEALLPNPRDQFHPYSLFQEYFAMPQRFHFFRLKGLGEAVQACEGNELDIFILMDDEDIELENRVNERNFQLYCTPAINLFKRRTDRIQLQNRRSEHHVIVDRTRPLDYEIYSVLSVTGYGVHAGDEQEFKPFYAATDFDANLHKSESYYSIHRAPKVWSSEEQRQRRRSDYPGSEAFISIVDPELPPYSSDLRQLGLSVLCTNRDLPIQMPIGIGKTDFLAELNAPVTSIRCVQGPTRPLPSIALGETAWRLISQLSLNYQSLVDDEKTGARSLRDILKLYAPMSDPQVAQQVEGLLSVKALPVIRRVASQGMSAFARGLEVTLEFDEDLFEGTGVFILGMVFASFFRCYVSLNSFTETVIRTKQRGEIMRWPASLGKTSLI